ncbi:hypothetical protein ABIE44_002609 [Marmoricola sp. OAE513]|uniref:hypothetical protein n=1 Tax=Marmoricola sp. OAE513 TaxID=2817894 RepID=UPI001AE7BAA9
MKSRAATLLLACLVLAGCGDVGEESTDAFTLPVGQTEWDVTAPAWFYRGTLHIGDRTVELGDKVDKFVLGRTGAYWMSAGTLFFTSAEGRTQRVAKVGWGNLAVSADRSVFATVDQSSGPKDRYGTRVLQLAVFDTVTGKRLYRTPDRKPDARDDLADLYGEIMPLLHGVSDERAFFYGKTIDLADGSTTKSTTDADGMDVYEGYADTLFPDGFRVSLRGEGKQRRLVESSMYAVGRLSPDRTTIFDVGTWPTPAVVYDAKTGVQRAINTPWDHFTLAGWTDQDTFYGVSERVDEAVLDNVVRDRQVVSCELRTLRCTPVSPVIPTEPTTRFPTFLLENSDNSF